MENVRVILMEAIARQRIVQVRYNGERIRLAPHFLFERHGELFIGALNLGKNWRGDDERRLGQFKLAGLGDAKLLDETFDPLPSYQAATPRAEDTLVLAI
ncbi:MAG: hypothetical protein ACTHLU_11895 [Novosphingobium sp.]